MDLPVNPPVLPMLAKRIDELPAGQTWIFELKWTGLGFLLDSDDRVDFSRCGSAV
jgi:hypothetical protein